MLFPTATAGSLPKPGMAGGTRYTVGAWKCKGGIQGSHAPARYASLLAVKLQETRHQHRFEGKPGRPTFVHSFLEKVEGIDSRPPGRMGIRNDRYKAIVPAGE